MHILQSKGANLHCTDNLIEVITGTRPICSMSVFFFCPLSNEYDFVV